MVAHVMLRDRGMVCLEGSFSGVQNMYTHFRWLSAKQDCGALWATHIDGRDIESTVGTILALTTRAVKRYVLAASAWSCQIIRVVKIGGARLKYLTMV